MALNRRGQKLKKKRSTPRGVNSVPVELRCGYPRDEDGEPCAAPRLKLPNGDYLPRCRHHKDHVPDDMPLDTLKDLRYFVADTMKRARKGIIPAKQAAVVSSLAERLFKIIVADMKMDPNKAARRVVTYEEALQRARLMTLDEAKEITEQRNKQLLEDKLHIQDVTELTKPVDTEFFDVKPTAKEKRFAKEVDEVVNLLDELESGDD